MEGIRFNKEALELSKIERVPLGTDSILSQKSKIKANDSVKFEDSNVVIATTKQLYELLIHDHLNFSAFDVVIFDDVSLTKEPQ